MVKYSSTSLDVVFSALADPTRRAIIKRLTQRESSITELAEPFDISLPGISKHLRVLEDAGLLVREIDGRVHRCNLNSKPLKDAAAWLDHYRGFWEKQFDSLHRYLKKSKKK